MDLGSLFSGSWLTIQCSRCHITPGVRRVVLSCVFIQVLKRNCSFSEEDVHHLQDLTDIAALALSNTILVEANKAANFGALTMLVDPTGLVVRIIRDPMTVRTYYSVDLGLLFRGSWLIIQWILAYYSVLRHPMTVRIAAWSMWLTLLT